MQQAAIVLVKSEPPFGSMPAEMRGICDSQYCAVALMLVGFSLEVCLKAMTIVQDGVAAYAEAEKQYRTHNLKKLAKFMVGLDSRELATLDLLANDPIGRNLLEGPVWSCSRRSTEHPMAWANVCSWPATACH
ncbi:hypothetical protein [Paraburkholderia sediminicola]|uniref:hypothetical protein n=1 Tax=Paraburkholderia sediminicola TaxID=458836 RepID=UPI0038B7BFB9